MLEITRYDLYPIVLVISLIVFVWWCRMWHIHGWEIGIGPVLVMFHSVLFYIHRLAFQNLVSIPMEWVHIWFNGIMIHALLTFALLGLVIHIRIVRMKNGNT